MTMSSTTIASTGDTGSSSAGDESAMQQGAQAVKEHAVTAVGTAKDEAASVVQSAAEHARTVLGSAGEELREQGRSQAERLSEMLGQASNEFGRMAEGSDTSTPAGRTIRTLADSTGQLAQRLDSGGPEGLMSDVSRFARRRPAVFLAASAAAGFAVGRLARSTDPKAIKDAVQSSAPDGPQSVESADTSPSGAELQPPTDAAPIDILGEVASTPTGATTLPAPASAPAVGGGLR